MPVVVLVDDQQLRADAIAMRLQDTAGVTVVGRYGLHRAALLRDLPRLLPEVIMIFVETAGPTLPTLIGHVRAAYPEGQILVLSEATDTTLVVAAVRAGADSWVEPTSSFDQLLEVLHGLPRGEAFFPAAQLGAVVGALREDARKAREQSSPLDALSRREREVLYHIVQGRKDGVIARELSISPNTVRTHTANILAKLNVHSRLEAASIARAAGMEVTSDSQQTPANPNIASPPQRLS
jgi:two-component system, NarL family, response regulator LiaR